ncbi:phosphopantetheine-binding protein [Halomonas sp. 328]|uniref:phosphopantetheine-binding protein n=1 Tax=Halomonas sp. 328 TaxID=2776704 RepID=UPI001E2A0F9F|nr:phosphopantetheine-binding protein [Halomonas sp. 328]
MNRGMTPATDSDAARLRQAIADTLARHLPQADLSRFAPEARLNEDLALDSIMLLQLLVHLELEHGLAIPEEAVIGEELRRVDDLVARLGQWQREAAL